MHGGLHRYPRTRFEHLYPCMSFTTWIVPAHRHPPQHPMRTPRDRLMCFLWHEGGFGWRDGTHNSVWALLIRGNATMSWYDGLYYSDPADNQDSNSFVPAATGWRS